MLSIHVFITTVAYVVSALTCGACSGARLHGFDLDPSIKVSRPQCQSPSVVHTLQ